MEETFDLLYIHILVCRKMNGFCLFFKLTFELNIQISIVRVVRFSHICLIIFLTTLNSKGQYSLFHPSK